jgi:hypothetical protein
MAYTREIQTATCYENARPYGQQRHDFKAERAISGRFLPADREGLPVPLWLRTNRVEPSNVLELAER